MNRIFRKGGLRWFDKLLFGSTLFAVLLIVAVGCSSNSESGSHEHNVSATESEQLETTASLKELPEFLHNHTPNTNKLYSEVGNYMDILQQLNCYCGCMDDEVPHDSLLRCYIAEYAPDKVVWTDHSTSCGICKMEMEDAIAMAKQGKSVDEIRTAIDDKYKPRNL
ncbi:PCYCGC motif-containing (lipo)protein [Paenibacillus tarimensis]